MTGLCRKVRAPDLTLMKARGERIVMLTAYDATMTRLLDRAGIDVLLVGDSLGQVILGLDTTIPVTLDAVIHHTRAVARGASRALVVADMPFLTYQVSAEEALRNAARLFQEGGAAAVKLEGGHPVADAVRRLTAAGLPVMGHVGLTPQHVHRLGGMRQRSAPWSGPLFLLLRPGSPSVSRRSARIRNGTCASTRPCTASSSRERRAWPPTHCRTRRNGPTSSRGCTNF